MYEAILYHIEMLQAKCARLRAQPEISRTVWDSYIRFFDGTTFRSKAEFDRNRDEKIGNAPANAPTCAMCLRPFGGLSGVFDRKHHCRFCHKTICDNRPCLRLMDYRDCFPSDLQQTSFDFPSCSNCADVFTTGSIVLLYHIHNVIQQVWIAEGNAFLGLVERNRVALKAVIESKKLKDTARRFQGAVEELNNKGILSAIKRFFKRHWKKILFATIIGVVIVGGVVAMILIPPLCIPVAAGGVVAKVIALPVIIPVMWPAALPALGLAPEQPPLLSARSTTVLFRRKRPVARGL